MMKLKNIDLFKGVLIILVIIGHILQGTLADNIWRNIIYSFHMPLFIGISGFLLNIDKIITLNFSNLLKKYWFRVIIPWTIAIIFYYIFEILFQNKILSFYSFKYSFIYPIYHLWFIPGFLSWIILTWILKKIKTSNNNLLLISFTISLISFVILKKPELNITTGFIHHFIDVVQHTIRPFFYFFFVLGLMYRNIELKNPRAIEYIFLMLFFGFVLFLYFNPNNLLTTINYFFLNFLLLSIVLKISKNNLIRKNNILEWFGKNSLSIYLWHVIPIFTCKLLFGIENIVLFYTITSLLEAIFIIIYIYLLKINILKKYAFGL